MNAPELIGRLCADYPQIKLPDTYLEYIKQQDESGHIIRRATTGQPLTLFLKQLGVSPRSMAHVLDSESRLALRVDYSHLLQLSAADLDAYLAEHLAAVFRLQEIVLDSEALTGFNRHGRDHLHAVTRRTLTLLQHASEPQARDPLAEKEAIIAGYLHDIGNLVSRREHGIYGIYLLTQLLVGVEPGSEAFASFLRVIEAVLFHEVEFGSRVPMLEELSPVTLSLIVADKTDVSFRRVSEKSNVPEALRDAHMLVNLLAGESQFKLAKQSWEWKIHFSPKIRADDTAQFSALLKRAERIWVPTEWHRLYRQQNIEYVFVFHATFLQVYFSRLAFAIRAIFALQPSLLRFRLVIQDDERGVSLSRVFQRGDYETKIQLIANNLFKNSQAAQAS